VVTQTTRQTSIPLRLADESGQTLPAEIVALAILALAVGLLLSGMAVGSTGVTKKHERVSASNLATSQLELITAAPYAADPTASPYPTVAPRAGYAVDVAVEYWIAPDGPFTASIQNDGLQRVSVSVSGPSGAIWELQSLKGDR
jgi:hypothetical protein